MPHPVLDGTEINNTQSRLLRSPQPGGKIVGYRCLKLSKGRLRFLSLIAIGKLKEKWFGLTLARDRTLS